MRTIKTISNQSICIIFLAVLCNISTAQIIYVDDDATGANNGTNWMDAYVYLQDALADAKDSDKPVEIRVAQGIYKPDQGASFTPGDREATFGLINGVTLKGGYAGVIDPNTIDIEIYETILSGDLNGDDVEVADPCDLLDEPTREENSYHVTTSCGTDNSAVLDGFTITGGFANGTELETMGGGIYCGNESSPIIENCTIRANASTEGGGGIFCDVNSYPTIRWCTIIGNSSDDGGGIDCFDESSAIIEYCTIQSNTTTGDGAGIYCDVNSCPIIRYCTISGNSADDGGGIDCWMSRPAIDHCIIVGNVAASEGGAIEYDTCYGVTIRNCTITGNQAFAGGGICYDESDGEIENCIVWRNEAINGSTIALEEWMGDMSFIKVTYTDVWNVSESVYSEAGCVLDWGTGNIDEDPLFAAPGYWADAITGRRSVVWVDGDYHLKSQYGRWDPNSESWVIDGVTSPCIDAGDPDMLISDPNKPIGDELFPNGGRINMGAYGGTREASMSLETGGLSLPDIAYIYLDKHDTAESFRSLLESYGCPTTLIKTKNVTATLLESCDLVIVADDTFYSHAWTEPNAIAAIEDSGKPIVGLGDGGYDFFGRLGLSIGSPHGLGNNHNSIYVIDPAYSLFSTPYPIDIPQDGVLQLYTETRNVALYFWPDIPETVVVIAAEPGNSGYYPLAMEHYQYLLWGFTESPDKMTETGKKLFINVVIWTANAGWESEN